MAFLMVFTSVAGAWRERLIDLRRDIRIRYVLLFKNHGQDAGASLYHPHSQLIATPIIPTAPLIQTSRKAARIATPAPVR